MTKFRKTLIALGAMIGLAVAAPGSAAAGGKALFVSNDNPFRVAEKIERIHYSVEDLRGIRDPFRRDKEIDRLQSRLKKLERRSYKQRGKQVKRNRYHIDRLQARLRHIEKKNNKRIRKARAAKRYDRAYGDRYDRRLRADRERERRARAIYAEDRYKARHDPDYYRERKLRRDRER
ncbi:MAG: hypothetical protein AAFV19_00285 [Pseudomonadota bacterium]